MTMIQIEEGVKIPASCFKRRGRSRKYPFDKLKVTNSFFVDLSSGISKNPHALLNSIRTSASRYSKMSKTKAEYVFKAYGTGVRVWRIK
jgi:hypothetical protein